VIEPGAWADSAGQNPSPAPWLFGSGRAAGRRRLLILFLFPAIVFINTLSFDFVYDDNVVVLEDPLVTGPLQLAAVFGQPVQPLDANLGFFRPIITLLYRADRFLWGFNPAGYHFTNLLLHLLVTFLVYQVAIRSTRGVIASWSAGLFFSVLPVHTEAIAWIQGRVDLAPTVFVLVAALCLLRAREAIGIRVWVWSALGALSYVAALFSKESAATFPLVWAVWEISGLTKSYWRKSIPGVCIRMGFLAGSGLVYWVIRERVIGGLTVFPMNPSPVAQQALGIIAVFGEYSRLLLLPDLSLRFLQDLSLRSDVFIAFGGAFALIVLGGGLAVLWQRDRSLLPWLAWIPITMMVPLLLVFYTYVPGITLFTADRYVYLPSVGWCIILGVVISRFLKSKTSAQQGWRMVAFAALLIGYACISLVRLQPWADPIDFYRFMGRQPYLAARIQSSTHDDLGRIFLERGEYDRAREQFLTAIRISPGEASPHNNMGVLLIREGRSSEAKKWIEAAIRFNPKLASAYGNLGAAYEDLGDPAEAKAALEAGLRIAPKSTWLAARLADLTAGAGLPGPQLYEPKK